MSIKNLLTEREERITKELKKLENKLNKLPEGLLVCNYRNGKVRWYEERTENGKRQRHYLSKRTDSSRIDDLVHKTYFTYKKRELEAELVGIGRFNRAQTDIKSDSLLQKSSPFYEHLSDLRPESNWENIDYEKSDSFPEHLIFKTRKGDMVRSKSEAYIADTLYELGIPYRYECRMDINGITLHPDFTILHPITGKIYIWEHWGLLHKSSYVQSSLYKTSLYISAGYLPGDSFIITSETDTHPLNYERVREIATMYFLD